MIDLYPYQKEYFGHVTRNFIYNMDTGTGKTYLGLHHWQFYFPDAPLLIVAPASKINEGGWQRTIAELLGDVEFEAVSYNKMAKQPLLYRDYFVIFDECHRLKNSTGQWGKAGFKITLIAKGFILLSATPTPNSWEDMINYFKMFRLTPNKTQFLKKHAVVDWRGYNVIMGWHNTLLIERQWEKISRRLNKDEAIDLPPITFKDVLFKPSADYRKLAGTRVLDDKAYDNMMLLRHGLRVNANMKDKIAYLKGFLEDTVENVLLFYNYDAELEAIEKIIPKGKKTYHCNGHKKEYPKKDEWSGIKNSVTLANYKSGSEAVEFTYTTIVIYFSPTESYSDFYQSYGRTHRLGQTNKVTAYKFITQNTIERDIYRALDGKKDFNINLWEKDNIK
jgi:superfamily II DNA or RNA helicase